jgi:phosphoribosyl-ATP pyrophosphohydrolase/phosphoribosyl-AMP cyclohydrolase
VARNLLFKTDFSWLKPFEMTTLEGQDWKERTMDPQIDFEKMGGLTPAMVQDADNGEILMLGFMNAESYTKTLSTGYVTFFSRTRNKLWTKGETSGNRLKVLSASTDCDNDALLFKVQVEGDGLVCHEGTRSCFTKNIGVQVASAAQEAAR